MAITVLHGLDEVRGAAGRHLGHSDWLEVTQDRVDLFAEATGDFQWIHVDPERAAVESPFGATIAHGYLTLALTNFFLPQIVEVQGVSMGLNYGLDRVRFPTPVPVGARIRGGAELLEVADIEGGVQTTMDVVVEIEDSPKPACVAVALSRFIT